MASTKKPALWLIAGPNGVGKTTYAYSHIRQVSGSVNFVNLDEIARGLSPLEPAAAKEAAARVALLRIREFIAERKSFSLETTLSGRTHLRTIATASQHGFSVHLLFFMVPTVEVCLARIARRVIEGGHDVPEQDVRRRYARAIANFSDYCDAVDHWTVLDNAKFRHTAVAEGRRGCLAAERDLSVLPEALTAALRRFPSCSEGLIAD